MKLYALLLVLTLLSCYPFEARQENAKLVIFSDSLLPIILYKENEFLETLNVKEDTLSWLTRDFNTSFYAVYPTEVYRVNVSEISRKRDNLINLKEVWCERKN